MKTPVKSFLAPGFSLCFPCSLLVTFKIVHPLFPKANALTESIIAAAIEVHRDKGPWPDRVDLSLVFAKGTGAARVNVYQRKGGFDRIQRLYARGAAALRSIG